MPPPVADGMRVQGSPMVVGLNAERTALELDWDVPDTVVVPVGPDDDVGEKVPVHIAGRGTAPAKARVDLPAELGPERR